MLERTNIPVAFQLQAMEGTLTHMFNVFSEQFAALKLKCYSDSNIVTPFYSRDSAVRHSLQLVGVYYIKKDHRSYRHNFCSFEKKAWKNSGLYGIRTLDLYDTGAALYQLS